VHTTHFTATTFQPAFHAPPAPFVRNGISQSDEFPRVVTIRQTPRRHKQHLPVLEVAMTGVVLVMVAFAAKLIMDLPPRTFERTQRPTTQRATQVDRVVVPQGQGAPGQGGRRSSEVAQDGRIAVGVGCQPVPGEDVRSYVEQAILACREGRFDDADELGRKAMRAAPRDPRVQAVRLLPAYLRQYSDLADEAIDRMNGSTEVDLGPRHGVGAFVERSGDEVVFMAKGRNVGFSLREFNSLNGVRFRVTRQFLENGRQPANDLILGAVHYVKQLDETGTFTANGAAVKQAASRRWETAAQGFDQQVASHAQALLSLLDDAGNQMAGNRQR
jgi:hypothetical protein